MRLIEKFHKISAPAQNHLGVPGGPSSRHLPSSISYIKRPTIFKVSISPPPLLYKSSSLCSFAAAALLFFFYSLLSSPLRSLWSTRALIALSIYTRHIYNTTSDVLGSRFSLRTCGFLSYKGVVLSFAGSDDFSSIAADCACLFILAAVSVLKGNDCSDQSITKWPTRNGSQPINLHRLPSLSELSHNVFHSYTFTPLMPQFDANKRFVKAIDELKPATNNLLHLEARIRQKRYPLLIIRPQQITGGRLKLV
ncbi:hypothetical protein WN944_005986 [Citrus x changshan-huyou]|uniref:Uncharacterized protein n=1 Tax=Citrus x changshan-huyou TaxID=2935761 RepID=A0AAP0MPQ3_9ROSI